MEQENPATKRSRFFPTTQHNRGGGIREGVDYQDGISGAKPSSGSPVFQQRDLIRSGGLTPLCHCFVNW
jgi:hypothetical protein